MSVKVRRLVEARAGAQAADASATAQATFLDGAPHDAERALVRAAAGRCWCGGTEGVSAAKAEPAATQVASSAQAVSASAQAAAQSAAATACSAFATA